MSHFMSKDGVPVDRVLNRTQILVSRSKVYGSASIKDECLADIYSEVKQRLQKLNLHGSVRLNAKAFGRVGTLDLVVCDGDGYVVCAVDFVNSYDGQIHGQAMKSLAYSQITAQQLEYALVLCVGRDDASGTVSRVLHIVEDWMKRAGQMIEAPPVQLPDDMRKDWMTPGKLTGADRIKIKAAIAAGTFSRDYDIDDGVDSDDEPVVAQYNEEGATNEERAATRQRKVQAELAKLQGYKPKQ